MGPGLERKHTFPNVIGCWDGVSYPVTVREPDRWHARVERVTLSAGWFSKGCSAFDDPLGLIGSCAVNLHRSILLVHLKCIVAIIFEH